MSLSADLDRLRLATATKAALAASLPPCLPCGASSWVAAKDGSLVCAGCGAPAGVGDNAAARVTPTPSPGAGMRTGGGEGVGKGEPDAGQVGGAGPSEGAADRAEPRSANPAPGLMTDPVGSGGGTTFSSVTDSTGCGAVGGDVEVVLPGGSVPIDRQLSSGQPVVPARPEAASSQVEVGVLRGKVLKQRKGTVEFYEDAKAAHRKAMRAMRRYIADRSGDPMALDDPTFRWCVQEVGKYAHSQAPREVKAETRLLIEFDMS